MLVHIETVNEFKKSIDLALTITKNITIIVEVESDNEDTNAYLILNNNAEDPKAYFKNNLLINLQEIGLIEKVSMSPFFAKKQQFQINV